MPSKISLSNQIIYEDEHLLIFDKPAGIAVIGGNQIKTGLKEMVEKHFGAELFLCHRLDRMTTGCLVFCKTKEAFKFVYQQFSEHQADKTYWALLEGVIPKTGFSVIKKLKDVGRKAVITESGSPAKTDFFPLSYFGHHFTLASCKPLTGRRHQIRVHAASAGFPIAGDTLYGGKKLFLSKFDKKFNLKKGTEERSLTGDEGFLLHAHSISFIHPESQQKVTFTAELPKQFKVCLKQLEKKIGEKEV